MKKYAKKNTTDKRRRARADRLLALHETIYDIADGDRPMSRRERLEAASRMAAAAGEKPGRWINRLFAERYKQLDYSRLTIQRFRVAHANPYRL